MASTPVSLETLSSVWAHGSDAELRQSEIVTDLIRYDYQSEEQKVYPTPVPVAIVFSQDCDLLSDHQKRSATGEGDMDHLLMMQGYTVEAVRQMTNFGTKEMKPLQQNLNPRWHYLESCPVTRDRMGSGFGPIVIDFRSIFAVYTREAYSQFSREIAKRRSSLSVPYREHFQIRAAQFLSRIVLPIPHSFN